MRENNSKITVSKKTAAVIVVSVILVLIVALIGAIAGHTVYLNNQKAFIVNYNTDFVATTPQTLTYYYKDGDEKVDFSRIVKVSDGASFSLTKIIDEDGTVSKPEGKTVDVSVKSQRLAVVQVVSASGKKTTDYRITVAPQSSKGNTVDFNVPDDALDLDDIFFTYSGEYDMVLPTPVKSYTGPSGNTVNFEFQGWYTTEDFQEGTEIEKIEAGTSGSVKLYAKFAPTAVLDSRDGYQYVYYGSYPQSQVTDYNLLKEIKNSDEYKNAQPDQSELFWILYANMADFTYKGKKYMKFTPYNVPNLSENGYSSAMTYVFEYEPVEWRVLKPKGQKASDGETVYMLSTSVLQCSSYQENGGFIQDAYESVASTIGTDITSFVRYYFDPDTMYADSTVKGAVDRLYKDLVEGFDTSLVRSRSFNKYTSAVSSRTESYSCNLWLLNYSEAINASYGFSTDFSYNDPLRKAMVSDFAAANGVYRATSTAHAGQGTWWLRGAGSHYSYRDKRVAYVKYTGYVHAYGALNFEVRSGVRPAIQVVFDSSILLPSA